MNNKILLLLIPSLIICLQGCEKKTDEKIQSSNNQVNINQIETALYQVIAKEIAFDFNLNATIQGGKSVEVRTRTEGVISKINFSENSLIKAGQVLIELDSRSAQIALENAQAILTQEQAKLENAKKNFENLKSFSLEQDDKNEKELEDAIVYQQLAESAVKTAMARVKEAELDLEYTRIQAPISGVAGKISKSEGGIIERGDNITIITQLDPVKAMILMPQIQLSQYQQQISNKSLMLPESNVYDAEIKVGDKVYESVTKFEFPEEINADNKNEIKLTIDLNNSKNIFKPQQSIHIKLKGAKLARALVIPSKAIVNNITDKYVYIFNTITQKADKRIVNVVEQQGDFSLLSSGLNVGDQIIVDQVNQINEKTQIKLKSASIK